jgi:hypothetical protein
MSAPPDFRAPVDCPPLAGSIITFPAGSISGASVIEFSMCERTMRLVFPRFWRRGMKGAAGEAILVARSI